MTSLETMEGVGEGGGRGQIGAARAAVGAADGGGWGNEGEGGGKRPPFFITFFTLVAEIPSHLEIWLCATKIRLFSGAYASSIFEKRRDSRHKIHNNGVFPRLCSSQFLIYPFLERGLFTVTLNRQDTREGFALLIQNRVHSRIIKIFTRPSFLWICKLTSAMN